MKSYKTIVHIMALSLFAAFAGAAPAKAFCLVNCEPKPERRAARSSKISSRRNSTRTR